MLQTVVSVLSMMKRMVMKKKHCGADWGQIAHSFGHLLQRAEGVGIRISGALNDNACTTVFPRCTEGGR